MKKNLKVEKYNSHERHFFDIPVFRCDKEQFNQEHYDKKSKLAQNIAGVGEIVTDREYSYSEAWLRSEWSAYYYSEMVGMIRLFAINMQIRGELWFVKQKISKNLVRKKWHLANPKIFEHTIHDTNTNEEIFNFLWERIEKENKEWILKGRYIDLEPFFFSGQSIDFLELADFSKDIK